MLAKHNLYVVAGQESWEKEKTDIDVEGYKWFGKYYSNQSSPREEAGVIFLYMNALQMRLSLLIV